MRPLILALLLLALPARAFAAADVPYTLVQGSTFAWGCFGACDCAVIERPLSGSFTLRDLGFDGLFQRYAVLDARFGATTEGDLRLTGAGTYKVGGEFAITQQLTLDLSANGGPARHFDSGVVPGGGGFPKIDATVSLHQQAACFDTVIHVVAAPGTTTGVDGDPGVSFACAPNPFRARTRFTLRLPEPGRVALSVYDAAGRIERRLAEGIELGAGPHEFAWDGRDESGARAAPGVYFVRGVAGSARLALRRRPASLALDSLGDRGLAHERTRPLASACWRNIARARSSTSSFWSIGSRPKASANGGRPSRMRFHASSTDA
jgi:hypothetical protein